ncbi:MAG: hypothetical protein HOQ24_01200 [Mycobacteriaceae bacterium]|nr:hypothetical protein [Mycobacteriaceae bacterium]
MRFTPALATAAMTVAAVAITAAAANAAPKPKAPDTKALPRAGTVVCPKSPDPENPLAPIPARDPRCGLTDKEILPGIKLRSNAYYRQFSVIGPDGSLTLFGSRHFQLRNREGNLIAGQDKPQHIPFGREITPPPARSHQTNSRQAFYERLWRVNTNTPLGLYTGDLTDMSVFLLTPMGSLTVQAPGTGKNRFEPGASNPNDPSGRAPELLNNFQVIDSDGRYVMGDALTFGAPTQNWPNAAIPCPNGSVPIVPQKLDKKGKAVKLKREPAPVCVVPGQTPTAKVKTADGKDAPPDPNEREITRQKDMNDAWSAVGTQFGIAVSVGALIGGMAGLALGCIIGLGIGLTGTGEALPAVGFVGTCLGGATLGASIGGTLGSLLLGVPVGVAAAANAMNTLRLEGDVSQPLNHAGLDPKVARLFPSFGLR